MLHSFKHDFQYFILIKFISTFSKCSYNTLEKVVWVWGWFFRFAKLLVLKTSQEFGGWFKLRIGLVPFTLHPMRINNLHKNVPTLVRNGLLMQEKIGEVCNQGNKISTSNEIRHQFFTPLEWGWLDFFERRGFIFKKPWYLHFQRT